MNSILCLSGWGQHPKSIEDSLCQEILNQSKIESLDYLKFNNIKEVFDYCSSSIKNPDLMIGWSLGAQISIRLIAKKIYSPKLLILIAPPFQLVKNSNIHAAMSLDTFNIFYNNFAKSPNETIKKFTILSIMNDKNKAQIIEKMNLNSNHNNLQAWLQELNNFSCFDIDFKDFPSTLLFSGACDMIVHHSQANYFNERIANIEIHEFKDCGHAPHLNNPSLFNKIILKKINDFFQS